MEEQKLVERTLMNEQEFKDYIEEYKENNKNKINNFYENGILYLNTYEAVSKFKSIRRAIRRGHVSIEGIIYPKRPFSNKANTCRRKGKHSRTTNEIKKAIYEQFKHKQLVK